MAVQLLACPLCSQPGFTTLDSLKDGLVAAASRPLACPICHDVLLGLDKLTIHLFGHCAQGNLSLDGAFDRRTAPENIGPTCATKPLIEEPQPRFERPPDSFDQIGPVESDVSGVVPVQRSNVSLGLSTISVVSMRQPESNVCVVNARAVEDARENSVEETRCDVCGISFVDPNVLLMHKQLVHATERKNFSCFLCTKVFKMRGSLMVHLRVAHGASNVGKSLGKSVDPEERPVVCNTCGKSFTKEQHLNQHMKTHEEKQWACDVCQKMFTTKYFLKKHKRLHTGEMPYSCNICHKAFTFQQSMHKHALYHSNDKPHSCPDCHRTFKELSTLTNHRRIHTGEKPFSCETCGKCFRQRVSYLVHRRIHTGVMPYQCTACGKSFRYKVSERSHKCPSQPPGVIVRQAGELLQKLQVKAAAHATATEERPNNAASQFIIIVDGLHTSGNVVVAQDVPSVGGVWSQRPDRTGEPHPWAEKTKREGTSTSTSEGTPDFFSVLEDLPSPSERLRNLTISPSLKGLKPQGMDEFSFQGAEDCPMSSDRSQDALQTINEESLKQLLYGTSLGGT